MNVAAAQVGDKLFLTKRLGVGMISTAQKKGVVQPDHINNPRVEWYALFSGDLETMIHLDKEVPIK